MPAVPELVLAAIAILVILAVVVLLAPTLMWVRRRFLARGAQEPETRTDVMSDPHSLANEVAIKATMNNGATPPGDAVPRSAVRSRPWPATPASRTGSSGS